MAATTGATGSARLGQPGPLRRVTSGISAVGVKELRGRMRGRRAFVVLTIYLVLLGVFAWMVALYLEQYLESQFGAFTYASAEIGRGVFGAMLMLETLLVVLLAPAFTTGLISMERERQTLDLLAATPISSFAIVVGKLLSALTYVFMLIAASIPLTALVFVFGGVSPDDVLTGYLVLVITAIGFGTLGLACSAVLRRTQAATVVAYIFVIALTLGTRALWLFWQAMAQPTFGGGLPVDRPVQVPQAIVGSPAAPEALVWLNPFMAQLDVICGTQNTYTEPCRLVAEMTGRTLFGGGVTGGGVDPGVAIEPGAMQDLPLKVVPAPIPIPIPVPGAPEGVEQGGGADGDAGDAGAAMARELELKLKDANFDVAVVDRQPPGTLRDALWPQFARAWILLSIVLVVLSVQLVSPTRRWRLPRPTARPMKDPA
jgi:ABC-type transport system involved in multi-copper enzyme maturation permease subunit